MSTKQRIEALLSKAEEADKKAEDAKDEFTRKAWQEIAEVCRDLARTQGYERD